MAVISTFSASFCRAAEIIEKLAQDTGYTVLDKQLIDETEKQFHVQGNKLRDTLNGHTPFLNNLTREKEKNIAYLKATLARLIDNNDLIYHGSAGHLLPNNIAQVLKVCILANQEHRIKIACEQKNISATQAKNKIRKDDESIFKWVHHLHRTSPWDEKLYDIIIPMHKYTVEGAVNLVLENLEKPALKSTPESKKAVDDFIFISKVNIPLVENGFDVNIEHNNGNISISLKEYVIRFTHVKEKITKIVRAIEGVKNVEVIMASDAHVPSRYDKLKTSPRFLLVDDEREYVQTLSDRLKTRDLSSTIAYDGEEALIQIENNEPDVMVLDLKMPGVDGMDVLRRVKKERPRVEVIILTGHGSEKDKALAMELGAYAYLEKPVDIETLSKTMREAYKKINKVK